MAVDLGIWGQANKPAIGLQDPSDQLAKMAAAQNAVNQNQLFQAQQQAGQAFQGAIDPTTGLPNQNRLGLALRNLSPASAIAVQPALAQAGEMQGQQVSNDRSTLSLNLNQRQNINGVLGSLFNKPDLSVEDIHAAAKTAADSGLLRPEMADKLLQGLTPNAPRPQLRDFVGRLMLQNMNAMDQVGQQTGTNENMETGAGTQMQVRATPMFGGGATQTGEIQRTVSPEAAAALRTTMDAQGNPVTAPAAATMQPGAVASHLRPLQGGPGRYPVASNATNVPGAGGTAFAGPSPGTIQAADVAGTQSGQALAALRSSVDTSSTRMFQLQKALSALQNTNTGPGTEGRNAVLSYLQATPVARSLLPANVEKDVANYDQANKYLTAFASQQAGAMGSGTDAKLATALSANASTSISNLAARQVVQANMALEKMQQAKLAEAQQQNVAPGQFADWSSRWATQNDPRAFAVEHMTQPQVQAMTAKMSDAERGTFERTYVSARRAGVIGAPNGR